MFYTCKGRFYEEILMGGEWAYVLATAPRGIVVPELPPGYRKVTVGGQRLFLSQHVFYRRVPAEGGYEFETVMPPLGARVTGLPKFTVEVERDGVTYHQYDKVYYRQIGDDYYEVVASPI